MQICVSPHGEGVILPFPLQFTEPPAVKQDERASLILHVKEFILEKSVTLETLVDFTLPQNIWSLGK